MAGFGDNHQPGGVYFNPTKALSATFMSHSGLHGAIHAAASAGGLRSALLCHTAPITMGAHVPAHAPYYNPHSRAGSIWSTIGSALSTIGKHAVGAVKGLHEAGVTKQAANLIGAIADSKRAKVSPGQKRPADEPMIQGTVNDGTVGSRNLRRGGGWF
jgi:hypothetical protein